MMQPIKNITPIGSCRISGPLKRAARAFGFDLNRARSYGYCHSSLEAVQQARFMQNAYRPTRDAWSLMAASIELETALEEAHEPSDAYVVELSSQKQLTWRGHAIQLNYLNRRFQHFFSDQSRAHDFWLAVDGMEADRWLERHWRGDSRRADRRVLADLRRSFATPKDLQAHLSELRERLPCLTVVTHVDVKLPNGGHIASRRSFVEMVSDVCRAMNIPVYEPGKLSKLFGQDIAIEPESDSYAHYAAAFEETIALDLVDHISVSHQLDVSKSDPKLERKDHTLLREASALQRRDDPSGAKKILQQVLATTPSRDRTDWMVDLHLDAKTTDALDDDTVSIIETCSGVGAAYLVGNQTQRNRITASLNHDDAADLLPVLSLAHGPLDTIKCATSIHDRFGQNKTLGAICNRIVPEWLSSLAMVGPLGKRVEAILGLHGICPENRSVLGALRFSRREMIEAARRAKKSEDVSLLETLHQLNQSPALDIREINLLWGRHQYAKGHFAQAKFIAEDLATKWPEHLPSWILLMRAADRVCDVAQSVSAAKQVQNLAEPKNERYATEARALTAKLTDAA